MEAAEDGKAVATDARTGGPKTERGKAKVSSNALVHGITSNKAVSRGDKRRFTLFLNALRDEFEPRSLLESVLVERVASNIWRLGRVVRWEEALSAQRQDVLLSPLQQHVDELGEDITAAEGQLQQLEGTPEAEAVERWLRSAIEQHSALADELDTTRHLAAFPVQSVATVSRYETTLDNALYRALSELRQLKKARSSN